MYIFIYFFICMVLLSSYSDLVIKLCKYLLTLKNIFKLVHYFSKADNQNVISILRG